MKTQVDDMLVHAVQAENTRLRAELAAARELLAKIADAGLANRRTQSWEELFREAQAEAAKEGVQRPGPGGTMADFDLEETADLLGEAVKEDA